ncbi:ech hydrogenase subunit C [Methanosarcina thermophila]|jgi:NADH-quinone oxidoreductase B subunit|uniref:Ech hydrogenase subunit C n=3 Tax=Methanosarcina thermophila TaxID=2210 RepID=A0A1I7AKF6_METTE|nr:NADH-quinone oxidoreductase subunit B family protein [Methanosarcina thermophila]ALK05965.1 MAG: NADH:ubiquinone oxidoreductase [Methanosarcina sp. 795]NLU56272.1 NADH-quinone oxidoreductase subunit B family protein [Methanosarcina thermophila]SFT75461.1 ech hydrogenase subunit C [Methanosarcina thermophila]BAW30173.1 ech hydrogenase subunit C [Methanosarcina thermophila]GLI14827.1 NADH ubiquinone oxidoreductase [Methanosarcina thermophila MST-A1]
MTLAKSPWIIHVNCNSCNGCDIEVVACLTPLYDAERFGILNIGTPKQADIMVVTGAVNYKNVNVLKNIYNQIPDPKVVLAVGACASTGGIFHGCYNVIGGVDQVIPVDVYVPGCTPRPEAIIDGIVACLPILEEKKKKNIKGQEVKLKGSEVPSTDNLASTTG